MVVPFAKTGEVQNAEKELQKEKNCICFVRHSGGGTVSGCQSTAQMVQMKKFSYTVTRHSTPKTTSPMSTRTTAIPGWACIRYGIGETLFHYSDSMEIEPWLAESYELVDDTTWRITLHEGISFTSGRTLDAEAVKECLEDLIAVHDRARGDLKIESIEQTA